MTNNELATLYAFEIAASKMMSVGKVEAIKLLKECNEMSGDSLTMKEFEKACETVTGDIFKKAIANKEISTKQIKDGVPPGLGASSISEEQLSSLRACGAFKGKKDEQ